MSLYNRGYYPLHMPHKEGDRNSRYYLGPQSKTLVLYFLYLPIFGKIAAISRNYKSSFIPRRTLLSMVKKSSIVTIFLHLQNLLIIAIKEEEPLRLPSNNHLSIILSNLLFTDISIILIFDYCFVKRIKIFNINFQAIY